MAQLLKNLTLTLGLISVLTLASCKVNGYRNGLKHGLWINKDVDGEITQKSRGRFKNGTEIGIWKYKNGKDLYKKEKYNGTTATVKFYHPNKKIMARGITQMELNGKLLHWYYHGDWKYFDTQGKLLKVVTYKKGNLVAEVPSNKPTAIKPTN